MMLLLPENTSIYLHSIRNAYASSWFVTDAPSAGHEPARSVGVMFIQ